MLRLLKLPSLREETLHRLQSIDSTLIYSCLYCRRFTRLRRVIVYLRSFLLLANCNISNQSDATQSPTNCKIISNDQIFGRVHWVEKHSMQLIFVKTDISHRIERLSCPPYYARIKCLISVHLSK